MSDYIPANNNQSPVLAQVNVKDTLKIVDETTLDYPVEIAHDSVKFLNNVVTLANATRGAHTTGATFSINVTGKKDRAYPLCVFVKTALNGMGVFAFWCMHPSDASFTGTYSVMVSKVIPGSGTDVNVTLTFTAGSNQVAVNFTNAANCDYVISLNYLDNLDLL